jgi:5'-AMP-activated protein kinase catalytic alpha subunit
MLNSSCGTLPFKAPEILEEKPYDFKVDVWALGVTLFKMLFNSYPFGNTKSKEMLSKINNVCANKFDLEKA